jgi:hypothetical protein
MKSMGRKVGMWIMFEVSSDPKTTFLVSLA